MSPSSSMLSISLVILTFVSLIPRLLANPVNVSFVDCFSATNGDESQRLSVDTVYAQVLGDGRSGNFLNLTVLGNSPQPIEGLLTPGTSLATLFTSTSVLTLNAWTNSSFFCTTLRPPSPLPAAPAPNSTYCPIPAGPFGFSSSILWGKDRALTTLTTRLRAVDPSGNELLCLDVSTTPLDPSLNNPYSEAKLIFWTTVALAIAYWVVVGVARIVSAWGRGISRNEWGLWSRAQSAGFILASAISGERLATSPALMRFGTPSMRDVIFHTQWCSALAMVAVQWPNFVYPLLTQTAWSTLSYNITLLQSSSSRHWDPLSTTPYQPPSNFEPQLADPSSPLFINTSVSNTLFTLPRDAKSGIESFAYTVGLHPHDLFPTCLILFLGIVAAAVAVSLFVWFVDFVACLIVSALGSGASHHPTPTSLNRLAGTRSPIFGKETTGDVSPLPFPATEEGKSTNSSHPLTANIFRPSSHFTLPMGGGSAAGGSTLGERGIHSHRSWWRLRSEITSFHGSVLQGNLVRILVLFHLPVTIFSVYQMTRSRSEVSLSSIVLAALSFTILSILVPAQLVFRVTFTTTNKLYDETRTLLALGPLYNHYRHGSQLFASLLFMTNLVLGITLGAGQRSGTAQAVVILLVEVTSALVTSIWLPWGSGASMGLISFLFCVARIVVAVLLLILSPSISIGVGPGGWVAYGILIVLALVYLALFLMLVVKLIEAVVRIIGGVGFDRSRHVVDSGLLGACGLLGCCGSRRNHRRRRARKDKHKQPAQALIAPQPPPRNSDVSSYLSPHHQTQGHVTPPRFVGMGEPDFSSRKGSTNSAGPPSVLRPEHALRPYREEGDDENGFIMGAWQPSRRPGYVQVSDSPLGGTPISTLGRNFQATQQYPQQQQGQQQQIHQQQQQNQQPQKSSGFSRVGGGRSHIDTPYAIMAGSTHTFPSIGQQSSTTGLPPPPQGQLEDDSPRPSLSGVSRPGDLPPGAMSAHIRTKSQSAIIEHAGAYFTPQPLASSSDDDAGGLVPMDNRLRLGSGGLLRPPVMPNMPGPVEDDDDIERAAQPKKKPWYHIGRRRPHSTDGSPSYTSSALPPADETAVATTSNPGVGTFSGDAPTTTTPGKSFVVIRKPQNTAAAAARAGQSEATRTANATT